VSEANLSTNTQSKQVLRGLREPDISNRSKKKSPDRNSEAGRTADVTIHLHEKATSASPSPVDANNLEAPWDSLTPFSICSAWMNFFHPDRRRAGSRCS